MQEYEFVIEAMNTYLCDQLASVICMENYGDKSYPHGYRRIYDEYCELRELYSAKKDDDFEKIKVDWVKKRQQILDKFVEDINLTVKDYDLNLVKKKYFEKLSEEDVDTLGKRIGIYPYLISEARKKL